MTFSLLTHFFLLRNHPEFCYVIPLTLCHCSSYSVKMQFDLAFEIIFVLWITINFKNLKCEKKNEKKIILCSQPWPIFNLKTKKILTRKKFFKSVDPLSAQYVQTFVCASNATNANFFGLLQSISFPSLENWAVLVTLQMYW